jgi:3-isopropylmalate/(R)-2-methylmalate dehydratase large subunit
MAMTLAEKIVARAAGRARVVPGEIVTCAVDLAMIHDSGGRGGGADPQALRRRIVGPGKVVLISDHYVPAGDDETRRIGEVTRQVRGREPARRLLRQRGHLHVVLPERGISARHVRGRRRQPFADRRRLRAYMFGIGATEMAACSRPGRSGSRCRRRSRSNGAAASGRAWSPRT